MPSSTKVLASLLAPAMMVAGLPVVPVQRTGSVVGGTDIAIFANAFLETATGGAYKDCSAVAAKLDAGLNLNLGLGLGVTLPGLNLGAAGSAKVFTSARALAFNKWASGYCSTSYHDVNLCAEISAYLSATYYAYLNGWAGVDLFLALGAQRVQRWHNLLQGTCSAPGCPSEVCNTLTPNWNDIYSVYANVAVQINAKLSAELAAVGILAAIDATAHLDTILHLNKREAQPIYINGDVHAENYDTLHLNHEGLAIDSFTDAKGNVFVGRDIFATSHGMIAAAADADLKLGHHNVLDATAGAVVDAAGKLHVARDITAITKATVAAAAEADVKIGHHNVLDVAAGAVVDAAGKLHIARDITAITKADISAAADADVKVDHYNIVKAAAGTTVDAAGKIFVSGDINAIANGFVAATADADVKLGHHNVLDAAAGVVVAGTGKLHLGRNILATGNGAVAAVANADLKVGHHNVLDAAAGAFVDAAGKLHIAREVKVDANAAVAASTFDQVKIGHDEVNAAAAAALAGAAHLDVNHNGVAAAGKLYGGAVVAAH